MSKKLLVIDDEKSFTTIISRIAEDLGFEVVAVNDPLQALEAVSRVQPDVLVVDMVMPHVDGVDILRHIAASNSSVEMKIIAMSGFGAGYLRLAKAIVALELRLPVIELPKPFRRADVVAALTGGRASVPSFARTSLVRGMPGPMSSSFHSMSTPL
ncbi:MAG TPA: response regulator [Rhodopila sp.]|uniref:response regulator n=1 Tax=Rhodopila sp. TaxID=2480087 RepID=UPI002CB6D9D9|nr:response regulator [Rhodopila sp.]HVY15309.1 response regulator [Rhodopila sp.]